MPSTIPDKIVSGIQNPGEIPPYICDAIRRWYLNNIKSSNIFSESWDMLIILDACRFDLMMKIAKEYDFISDVSSTYSVAAQSEEWMEATFRKKWDRETLNTAVITGNIYSKNAMDEEQLFYLDEVWKYAWDDSIGTVKSRPITDRAISVAREINPERLLVHYMQPHFPCVPTPRPGEGVTLDQFGSQQMTIWKKVSKGQVSVEEAKDAALRNLRYVLNDVEILLSNVEAEKVVITADHGNAFGENGELSHPRGSVSEVIRKVPWITTTASDEETHSPAEYNIKNTETNREDQLRSLGYL